MLNANDERYTGTSEISPEGHALLSQMTDVPILSKAEEQQLTRALKYSRKMAKFYRESVASATSSSDKGWYHLALADAENAIQALSHHLFYANIKWALKLVNKNTRLEFMDRFQWAAMGLWHAIEKFDPDKRTESGEPIRFSTYATYWIRQAMQRGADADERLIRLPSHASELLKALARARSAFRRQNGCEPTVQELCAFAELDYDRVHTLVTVANQPLSLHWQYEEDENAGDNSLIETVHAGVDSLEEQYTDHAERESLREQVRLALDRMSDYHYFDERRRKTVYPLKRHAQILRLRFRIGEPPAPRGTEPLRTLEEAGALLSPPITKERVRQLKRVATAWLLENEPGLRDLWTKGTEQYDDSE